MASAVLGFVIQDDGVNGQSVRWDCHVRSEIAFSDDVQ